ncbi:FtsX-like permease family protein [Dysgonomonas sp. 511]|uniref:FtsX-like permease family protein n=1 Tax=Dysgonomonas sp. 511 TaxID=2302930 RepID=UPI0013D42881|nr:FtsX-like permease family protein [Dysgonomonas sp. 511]NDV77534.1 ABC transporter permease [Dysgonomonas sp. 511]
MNLPLHIARRYLFAKKSHNAINVISFISVCGIAVATAALVCALSVFNGFTSVAAKMFSDFDPELQIAPAQGKVFNPDSEALKEVYALEEIDFISQSLEENALAMYGDRQEPILLKGVSPQFEHLANIDTLIIDGSFVLREGDTDNGVIGAGLAMLLGVRANFREPVELYVPKRNVRVNPANPSSAFDRNHIFISGVFALNQAKYDDQMLIVPIELARELLRYDSEVSSLDIKLKEGASVGETREKIKALLGENLLVKDRFEQQEDMYRMVNIEKWVTFLILAIILIIAAFNVVGSLSMLIIEKNDDIAILKNMGASNHMITRIFMFEGWLINMVGAVAGLVFGLAICLLQQHFGLLKLGSGQGEFVVDAYPVVVYALDVLLIFIAVSVIGFFAVLYPVNNLRKRLLQH